MEITALSKNILKLRGKNATLIISFSASLTSLKTVADGIIFFDKDTIFQLDQLDGVRLAVAGPGEYEVGGIKISSESKSFGNYYTVIMDNITMFVGKSDFLSKVKDSGVFDYKALILLAQGTIDIAAVTALTPSLVVLHGEASWDMAKTFGVDLNQEGQRPISKIVITAEKLPEEMQVNVL